ncbi:MAG: flagellar filament capping protein FliD [Polynucleobacter sp.]
MAVSSTNSSSSTASIDVSGIVQQLMTAENRPLETLKTKITQQQVVISDLGNVKAKVSTFKDALASLQNPSSYNNMRASTSDSAVVTATAANGSVAGSYAIQVSQMAAASKHALSGYSSATTPITVNAANGFVITVGNTQFSTKGVVKVDGVVSSRTVPSLAASPKVSDLANWINGLGSSVKAGVVQTTASDQWALTIEGTVTGTANAVTFTGLETGTVNAAGTTEAKNAQFSINGIAFERSSNTVSNAIDGLTINLLGTTAVGTSKTIAVSQGADGSEKKITDLVTAYNDLMGLYKTLTANSVNSDKPGTFAGNPTMLGFIGDIKSRLATGFAYGVADPVTGKRSTMSLASLGMDLQRDGTIKFNSVTHAMAISNGLQATLSKGIDVGYASTAIAEKAEVSFKPLAANKVLTLGGYTFTAGSTGASANQLASAFAGITATSTLASLNTPLTDATVGQFTALGAGWTSSVVTGAAVTFTSTTLNTDVPNLAAEGNGAASAAIVTTPPGNTLLSFVTSATSFNGPLSKQIEAQNNSIKDLKTRQGTLETKLNAIQNNFIKQYSALNTLLFQLSSTSNSLTSALDALTNNNNNK